MSAGTSPSAWRTGAPGAPSVPRMSGVARLRALAWRGRPEPLDPGVLLEVRAALAGGASPAAALSVAGEAGGPLDAPVRSVRIGRQLVDVAAEIRTQDAAADLLVQALALAERAGTGAAEAVEQALAAVRDRAEMARLLGVRTTRARGAATVMLALPVVLWVGLALMNPQVLAWVVHPVGRITTTVAAVLMGASALVNRRIVRRAADAAAAADPLRVVPRRIDRGRAVAGAVGAGVIGLLAGPGTALVLAVIAGYLGGRVPRSERAEGPTIAELRAGGAVETVELLGVALSAGMTPPQAVAAVTPLAPPAAQAPLAQARRRLDAGLDASAAFADSGLAAVGRTVAVAQRWGAPAVGPLRELATELRADRRAAVERTAERIELSLVFPTTLLALPGFALGVVPPLLWTAFVGASSAW